MAYPISDVPRRIVYSGSAGVGPYAFTFEVLTASDIAVYKNQTLLTLTTDYTVSINTGTGTGTVTLVVAATGADTVTLVGDRAIQRTSDFVTGGDLFANTLNAELDAQTIYAQQIDEKAERAIRAPVTDPTTINMVLPPQATRASKALGFSSNGNPTQSASTLAAIDAAVTTIQTIAAASPGSSAGISHIAAGLGAVVTTVQAKLRDVVSLADFGAVGDGVTDDSAAIASALATNKPLEWVGTAGKSFRINSQISHTPTADVIWYGQGATLTYAGSHAEYALRLNDATGVEFIINDLTLDGGKLCNTVLWVLNNTSLTTPSEFTATNLYVKRAKRINTFNGGEGVRIRGAFNRVMFSGGGVSDCELPVGQGTPGSIGIAGVSIDWYGTTSYVRECIVNGIRVEKVYSSDLSYNDDQDGFVYFAPTDGTRKVPSNFSCTASEFVNCYGRSIKTQCRDTVIQASSFIRSEGLTRGYGNGEIDAQTGNGTFRDNSFSYTNAQEPLICVNVSGSLGTPGMIADGNSVVLDTSTTLTVFAQVFPSAGLFSRHAITNNKIFGKVKEFFSYNANGNKNYADVSNNYIGEMVDGDTSQKAMVYVRANGGVTPYFANITATGNFYDNTHAPALVRDGISGSSMPSAVSAWNNFGFTTNNVSVFPNSTGLRTNLFAQIDKVGTQNGYSYFKVFDLTLPGSGEITIDVGNYAGALVIAQMQFTSTSACIFSSDSTNGTNTVIHAGSEWGVGNTADPGSGTFRVWIPAQYQLKFKNTDASTRVGALWVLTPGT